MKKILVIFLALVLLLGVLAGSVFAAEGETEEQPAETVAETKAETKTAEPGAALRKMAENMRVRAKNFAKIAKKYAGKKIGDAAKTLAARLRQVANRAEAFAELREDPEALKADRLAARRQLVAALRRAANAADAFAAIREANAKGTENGTPGAAVRKLAENLRQKAEKLAPKKAANNK